MGQDAGLPREKGAALASTGSRLIVHRCFIVNLDRVKELQACGGGEYIALLRNGKELPLGATYRNRLATIMQQFPSAR